MKRYCKHIDITDWRTVLPWVTECVLRHKKRYDFRSLVCYSVGRSRKSLSAELESGDNSVFLKASEIIAKDAVERIKNRELNLKPVTYKEREDNSSRKIRLIGNESAMQQVFDYIAVRSCEEIWSKRLVKQQIAGLKNRGAIYGTRMIQGWIDKDNKAISWAKRHNARYSSKCKYFVKADVKQCYPSLRTENFMRYFRKDCANETILWLWEILLNSHSVGNYNGFMIGALSSQWACQYMMSFIYRHVLELHSTRRNKCISWVSHVAIQMDDILLLSSSKKSLKKAMFDIIHFAKEKLGLHLKLTWQIQKLETTPIDIVGYKLYRDGGVSVRSRIFLRARRCVLRVSRRFKMSVSQARRLTSYKGFFVDNGKHRISRKGKHSDSRRVFKKYKFYRFFSIAEHITSRFDRGGAHYEYACLL